MRFTKTLALIPVLAALAIPPLAIPLGTARASGTATAGNQVPAITITAAQTDAARRVCRDTLGLAPANVDFAACVDSLKTQAAAAQQPVPEARACAEMGHTPGGTDHRHCVAQLASAVNHAQTPLN
ncbi:hypothetical protein UAJ10_25180 [Nitrospirillum sp. BR 11164]|uniref:hypothetical protein n=1 Tax=Nitrospirillum sp. BR 11164 TaxID=3104324 RepID=UPI002AFFB249|nr:hypothetical protein [Nitrospirillum sp. BR 11164]MEA1652289.1 hypothetical protein [Nitrospirillum sp. BR 11164]